MREPLFQALIVLCLACAPITSAIAAAESTTPVQSLSATAAVERYAAASDSALEQMLVVLRALDANDMDDQQARALMDAVKSFDAKTAGEYEQISEVIAGIAPLRDAVDDFRADQATLATRLLNTEVWQWDAILAEHRRLAEAIRAAAKSPSAT